MIYEYTITCLSCAQVASYGGSATPIDLSREQVLAQAKHHPGCPVLRMQEEQADELILEQENETFPHAIVTHYRIVK